MHHLHPVEVDVQVHVLAGAGGGAEPGEVGFRGKGVRGPAQGWRLATAGRCEQAGVA